MRHGEYLPQVVSTPEARAISAFSKDTVCSESLGLAQKPRITVFTGHVSSFLSFIEAFGQEKV